MDVYKILQAWEIDDLESEVNHYLQDDGWILFDGLVVDEGVFYQVIYKRKQKDNRDFDEIANEVLEEKRELWEKLAKV